MIVNTINSVSEFVDQFYACNRGDNFSYNALEAMFNFFEEYSEGTGEPFKLDVIAICCDFVEYGSMADAISEYWDIETREALRDWTIVIDLDDGGLVMQRF